MRKIVAISMSLITLYSMGNPSFAQGGARPLLTPEESDILRHGRPYATDRTASISSGHRDQFAPIARGRPTKGEPVLDQGYGVGFPDRRHR
jgi:hypothetical protein